MINCQQELPGVRPIFIWGNHLGRGLCELCKSKPTKQTGCFPPLSETNAFLHSLSIIQLILSCQDFTAALAGTSEVLSCYLWTRLLLWLLLQDRHVGFFGFILILPHPQPRCLHLGRDSSVLAAFSHHPVLTSQPGHCKACSCGWDQLWQSVQWTKAFCWFAHLGL